jgi:hypothetical protein
MSKFTMKNKLKLAFLAIAAITSVSFISGCSTGAHGEQIFGMTGSVAWFRTASMQTKINYFKPDCLSYGFKDGTQEMSQCLQSAIQDGESSARQRHKSFNDSLQRSRRRTCTTYGNRTTCN